jgi:integrase
MKRQDGYLTRESGSWLGHYSRWVTDYSTGQRTRQQRAFKIGPVSGMTKTQAREKLRERVVRELGLTADSRATVAWFIEHRWKSLYSGTWRDSTAQTNAELLKVITDRFGSTAIEDMDTVTMQSWLNSIAKTRSGSAVKHLRIFLRSIMAEATEQDYLRKNTARLLRVPVVKKVRRPYLTLPQIKELLHAARYSPRDTALLSLLLVTALRPSELFALKWGCLDADKGTLTISETVYRGKVRPWTKTTQEGDVENLTMFVPDAGHLALVKWHSQSKFFKDSDYIFPNADGGFILKENYQQRILNPLAEQAGIKHVNFQVLRRTVATHAQHLGSPKDISVIMRHRKVETSQQHYIQAIAETVKQTTEKLAAKMLTK